MSRRSLLLLEVLGILLLPIGGLTTWSFVVAKTPAEVAKEGGPPMPSDWEAGVFNHGAYYRWCTIANHPMLFGLSVAAIAAGCALIICVNRTQSS